MERRGDYGFKASEGMHFVLTKKGKEWASYRDCEVGQPIDAEDDRWADRVLIEDGVLEEVPDPDWVEMPGFRAVYDCKGDGKYIFDTGNAHVFHDREMAELAAQEFNERSWHEPWQKAYVIDATYKGKRPKPCREYKGKPVYNMDYWTFDRPAGCYVEPEIANYTANVVPSRSFSRNYIQCGEPYDAVTEGLTYATFVRVADDVWEWKGNCLAGKTEPSGTPIPIVKGA